MRRCVWLTATLALSACVTQPTPPADAQTTTETATPAPACAAEAYRQFDFWLGAWDVFDPSGTFAGGNEITSAENGCLLIERWRSAKGGTGQSYNYYDPATKKWNQLWVSPGAVIDYSGGLTPSGSMKLTGEIKYHSTGLAHPFTGEWTPNPDGTVTQHFQQYNAETGQWDDWFTGTYRRPSGALVQSN